MPHRLCKRCGRELRRKGPDGGWFCPGRHFFKCKDMTEDETEEAWHARADYEEEIQNRPPPGPMYRYLIRGPA